MTHKKKLPGAESHLIIHDVQLLKEDEWSPTVPDWTLMRVVSGNAYWLEANKIQELDCGSVIALATPFKGVIRASTIGPVSLEYFSVCPEHLPGLVSVSELNYLKNAPKTEVPCARFFPASHSLAESFRRLTQERVTYHFKFRLGLLNLFTDAFNLRWDRRQAAQQTSTDAKVRLNDLLGQMLGIELLNTSYGDLVKRMRCTPRHFSRLFREAMGMSFRDKQAEIRLHKACLLLKTTEMKIVDVAMESGYPSLSLFNLMFKKYHGVSPGKWRERRKANRSLVTIGSPVKTSRSKGRLKIS